MKESYLLIIGMTAMFAVTLANAIVNKSYVSTFCAGIIGGQTISLIVLAVTKG